MGNITKAVQFMIDAANNDTHGYDQTHRNSPDFDCSSLVATALHKAGFNVSPTSWTGNLEVQLRQAGFKDCVAPWKSGDIHLTPQKHVAMSVSESLIVHATLNEFGGIKGGKTGDQTGQEICVASYYEYPWTMHLRYTEHKANNLLQLDEIAREVIRGNWGNGETRKQRLTEAGYNYREVQDRVNAILGYKAPNKVNNLLPLDEIAREVIRGNWGNGETRKQRLTEAGYNYREVQDVVNAILGYKAPNKVNNLLPLDEIASEVIRGYWGNGETRKQRLTEAGYNYREVQDKVNKILLG